MNDILKLVVSVLSIGAGPLASSQVPAMAPDLRPWAWWLSGIGAAAAFLWSKVHVRRRSVALRTRDLKWSLGILLVSAVAYFLVNLIWTRETGGVLDVLFTIAIVLSYTICFGSLTFAIVTWQSLAKSD